MPKKQPPSNPLTQYGSENSYILGALVRLDQAGEFSLPELLHSVRDLIRKKAKIPRIYNALLMLFSVPPQPPSALSGRQAKAAYRQALADFDLVREALGLMPQREMAGRAKVFA